MTKIEKYSLLLFGFFIFSIVFIRLGFFMTIPVTNLTIIVVLTLYVIYVLLIFQRKIADVLLMFLVTIVGLGIVTALFANTFDTSWDGQGYHQTAVIAMARGWNPVYEAKISLLQELPSQIFAESYPSALWEIESSIYSLAGKINAAKVVNVAIGIVALTSVFTMLRKLGVAKYFSIIISLLIVLQPLYVLQLLTFMQDGFGYQLLVIAISSLIVYVVDRHSQWSVLMFYFSMIMLVSTKYSHLPVAVMLGVVYLLITANRFLNREYHLSAKVRYFLAGITLLGLVFAFLPYIRNTIYFHYPFYPTNIPELSGAVTYNNLPHNLQGTSKPIRLFYGIFSSSQSAESGDPRSETNIATLKVPFTFTLEELIGSTKLYNNRAGAAGPIFSGIFVLGLIIMISMSFKARNMREKYAIYAAFFVLGMILLSSLLVPTPNLLRYVSQIQLLPFVFIIPLVAVFKGKFSLIAASFLIVLLLLNSVLYTFFVINKNIDESSEIRQQYQQMRDSGKTYRIKALHFYSSYVLLAENGVPYIMMDRNNCNDIKYMPASSTSTMYCEN